MFGFGFAGFGIVIQIREADFGSRLQGKPPGRRRAGKVALAFGFAVVADDAVVCAQVDGVGLCCW